MSPIEEVRNAHRESPSGTYEGAADLASDREVLLDIVARVEALHAPVTVCEDCAHPTSPVCPAARSGRVSHTLSVVCAACCTDGRKHQLSICVMTHDHTGSPEGRCFTIATIYASGAEGGGPGD
ncbi:hypothetical protein CRM73_00355 [Kocuria sp. CCUG 69068]|uniref:hypothetical protein n=1 Tax=Kocuria sp. CCUG 69068 TaxID=2043138 RepID=UPI001E4414B3|nr:hypothetical protein [Kocuria sp. CCUG 69068]